MILPSEAHPLNSSLSMISLSRQFYWSSWSLVSWESILPAINCWAITHQPSLLCLTVQLQTLPCVLLINLIPLGSSFAFSSVSDLIALGVKYIYIYIYIYFNLYPKNVFILNRLLDKFFVLFYPSAFDVFHIGALMN